MIYATLSNRDKVNNNMQNIKIGNRKFYKYILLCQTSSDMKAASSHINNANNIEIRYEYILKVQI